EIAGPCSREAADSDPANPVGSLRVFVFPGDVIARARRQYLDIVLSDQALREQPAQLFRSAEDFAPVPLNDQADLHEMYPDDGPPTMAASSRSIRSSLK